jgi:hypothetical protein
MFGSRTAMKSCVSPFITYAVTGSRLGLYGAVMSTTAASLHSLASMKPSIDGVAFV